MRLLFAGTPEPAADVLRRLIDAGFEFEAVLTRPDAPAGRGRGHKSSAVSLAAQAAHIEVYTPRSLRSAETQAWVASKHVDAVVVVAYGLMVPESLLTVPRYGWLNLHFSLLPMWRGAAPVQRAIEAGDDLTGVTVFRIEAGLDTGPMYGQATEQIGELDNAQTLFERLCASGSELMSHVLMGLETGTLAPRAQDESAVTWARRITVDEARIDWRTPAIAISRKVRAFTPAPGAWTTMNSSRVKVAGVLQVCAGSTLSPGSVRIDRSGVRVGTGSSDVLLDLVQPAGKPLMRAADWARGIRAEHPEFR